MSKFKKRKTGCTLLSSEAYLLVFKSESCPLEEGGRDYVFSRHRLIR